MTAWLRALGLPGLAGLALLAVATTLWRTDLAPLERRAQALEQRLEAQSARPLAPSSEAGEAQARERLRAWYAALVGTTKDTGITDVLAVLHANARALGLASGRGDYRLERVPDAQVDAYTVTLPLAGSYPALRTFIEHVLHQAPQASLDAVRFERRAQDDRVEATVTWTFLLVVP